MINCQEIFFSKHYSKKRIEIANSIIGEKIVKKIIAFALYLLGASRREVAQLLKLPYDTFKSFTNRIEQEGISVLIDRRLNPKKDLCNKSKAHQKVQAEFKDDFLIINFGLEDKILKIPKRNTIQIKTIVLTLLENNFIDTHNASILLNCSSLYIQRLNRKLHNNDVFILIDKRHGQQQDYIFKSEIKAEIIQQFSVNAAIGKKTSSQTLVEDLKERCNLDLSSRSIRFHIEKLGLSKIKNTLPQLIESFKKKLKI